MLNRELQKWMSNHALLFNRLSTEEKEQTNKNLFLPVANLASVKKANEAHEQNISAEDRSLIELVSENSIKNNADGLPRSEGIFFPIAANIYTTQSDDMYFPVTARVDAPRSENVFFPVSILASLDKESDIPTETEIEDDEPSKSILYIQNEDELTYDKLISIPDEETVEWKDYKEDQFNGFYIEEKTDPVETEDNLVQSTDESDSNKQETVDDSKSNVHIPQEPDKKDEVPRGFSDDEIMRAYEDRKARMAALEEEYRESQRIISEQIAGKGKKVLVWVGSGLVFLFALMIASLLLFYSGETDPNIDLYTSASNNLSSTNVAVSISEDNAETTNGKISSSLEQNTVSSVTPESSQVTAQNVISSEPANRETITVGNRETKEQYTPAVTGNDARRTTDSVRAEGRTPARATNVTPPVQTARTTRVAPPVQTARATRVAPSVQPARAAHAAPPVQPTRAAPAQPARAYSHYTQDEIFSAIRNEKYADAINLSKRNLERNPKDRLSFFSLGVAYYASSDFNGATRAFYACLTLDRPALPKFMVEEFDTNESLRKLFINYPEVELLIRAVELNPQDKPLYLNLFLSSLKSENPRDNSDIYYAILRHANKHGTNK